MIWLDKWLGQLHTEEDCVRFVNDLGFCTIDRAEKFSEFPSQAEAMDVDMAIGETWFWKDDLHVQRRVFYTRLFFNKPGYISMEFVPAFIATNGQVADELIVMGRMPAVQQAVYDIIEKRGPISSADIRDMLSSDSRKQSATALIALERAFIITKTGITGRTRGTYGYVWDMLERWLPDVFEQADSLGAEAAREIILKRLQDNGVDYTPELTKAAFGWS